MIREGFALLNWMMFCSFGIFFVFNEGVFVYGVFECILGGRLS